MNTFNFLLQHLGQENLIKFGMALSFPSMIFYVVKEDYFDKTMIKRTILILFFPAIAYALMHSLLDFVPENGWYVMKNTGFGITVITWILKLFDVLVGVSLFLFFMTGSFSIAYSNYKFGTNFHYLKYIFIPFVLGFVMFYVSGFLCLTY
jgi:hypothetical protein